MFSSEFVNHRCRRIAVVAHGIWNMRLRTTLTFWIKKFRSLITVAHGMLGNAIQAPERSIVTITFSVKKKEEKKKKE